MNSASIVYQWLTVADPRGRARRSPPPLSPWPKIFSISCSFLENLAKSYVAPPLEGWRPLLRGILYPSLAQWKKLFGWMAVYNSSNVIGIVAEDENEKTIGLRDRRMYNYVMFLSVNVCGSKICNIVNSSK